MRRGKRLLAALLAGTLVCSGGGRYNSAMAFSDDAESFVLSDENAEYEEQPAEEQISEEPAEEADTAEIEMEEEASGDEESAEEDVFTDCIPEEPEEETSEEDIEFVAEESEDTEDPADTETVEKKCIASFNFDSSEDGLQGSGAKAEVIDSSRSVLLSSNGYHGRALYLDGNGESALKVTKEDGSSLLTGVDELTVSYYSRPTDTTAERSNWGFYAAASEGSVIYNSERYLGIYEITDANGKRTVGAQRYNNNGSRPPKAITDISQNGWHHIVAVFSSEEISDAQPEEDTQAIEAETEAAQDVGDGSFDTEASEEQPEDSQEIEITSEDISTYAADDTQTESRTYKVSLYIDGEKKAEVENPYALTDVLGDSSILQIGKANWKNGEYYKGYIDEYSIYNYAMTNDEVRNFTVQPSEAKEFSRILYFDNALSRLEGVEPDTSDGLDANGTEESSLYYSYDNGKNWYSMSKVDADEDLGKQVSYVSLWKATVPETAVSIQFRGWYKGYKRIITYATGYRTSEIQTIPTETSLNCYYGNPMVYQLDTSGTVLNGHWANVNTINTEGQQSVEIPDGTFTRDKNLYYGNSSFFDYYSDYELNGAKLSQSNATSEDEFNDQPLYAWNLAIDRYYKGESSVKPLYFGGARMMLGNGDLHDRLTGYDGRIAGGNGFSGANKTLIGNNAFFPNKGLLSTTTLDGTGLKLTNSNLTVPYFDADYLLGDNEEKTQFASVYQNIAFPFEMSDSGYWTFDSSDANYALQMKKDSSSGKYFLEQTKNPVVYGTQNYFFPFNSAGTHGYNSVQKLDYMFGSVIEVPFALTDDRKTIKSDGSESNTVFTFSGDDDVWIFLEGPDGVQHLVLDIGGSHGAVSGAIDFTSGLVATSGNWSALGSNSGTATAMGKDDFIRMAESGGVQSIINQYSSYIWSSSLKDMGIDVNNYQSYKEYKIKVYYMERGLDQSNLRITFNFVNNKNVEVKKEWSDGAEAHANDKIGMTLYQVSSKTGKAKVTDKADIGVQYAGNAKVDSEDESGSVELNTSNNWSCRWGKLNIRSNDINSDETYSYYVAESGSPAGYVVQYYNNTDGTRLETEELTLEDGTKVKAVPASDVSVSIRVENKKVGRLSITKESADLSNTHTNLSGVTFELYQSNDKWKKVGNVLATKTTDTNGLVTFDDLFPGNYLLYETVGGEGLYKPEEPWKITVAGDGTVTILDKTDQNLAVLNSQDATDGYTDNQTTIINYRLLNLELLKIDAEDRDKPLAGVKFKLERQLETGRWRTIATRVTDENGCISGNGFQGLQEGNYRLTETKAAAGYNLLKEPISFIISYGTDDKVDIKLADETPKDVKLEKQQDNFTVKLTVSNTRGTVMPATGGSGTEKFLFGGCLFLIAGLLYGYNLRRRRERRRIR